jgi:mannose/fructose/N-acetylgalactosamine-specific phosphotransferase system component IIB
MKKSEAFDSSLKKTFDECCEGETAYIGGVNLTTNDTEISNRLAVTDKNIDQLRQWLNEDRIDDFKKMITNDDIKFWLDIK